MGHLKITSTQLDSNDFDQIARECVQESARNLSDKQLEVVIDSNSSLPSNVDRYWFVQAIRNMLNLAIERSPYRSEIQLTACRVGDALEVEVADNGELPTESAAAFRHTRSTSFGPIARELMATVQARGAEFWGTSCPQGGMAWTLRLPLRRALAKAA